MSEAPLAIDLFCGLGGWTEGLLAEGYYVVGFDIEQHVYGEHRYPAQFVLQDVRSLHGRQFKDAALIVGSSPCQEFSYRAMPWKRAKALGPPKLGIELFEAQFRIQREACAASQVAWSLHHGRLWPEGMLACHTCDNPRCVNPTHIWPGTMRDNLQDASRKGRVDPRGNGYRTHCKRGHPFSPENTIVKTSGHRACRTCRDMHNAKRYRNA